ncbi:hypothetical protein MMC30_001862 [Trapelia coarctata]|nr:hypothetical protein [Trapelia coarctata]
MSFSANPYAAPSAPPNHPLLQRAIQALRTCLPASLIPTQPWSHAPAWIMAAIQYIKQLQQEIRTHEAAATMSQNQVDRLKDQINQQTDRLHKLVAAINELQAKVEGKDRTAALQVARIVKLRQQLRELGVEVDLGRGGENPHGQSKDGDPPS